MRMGVDGAIRTETPIAFVQRSMKQGDDYVTVLDLRSAYDEVDRHKLLDPCEKLLAAYLMDIIRLTLGPLRFSMVGDASQYSGELRLGVTQSSPLCPDLFNIYRDPLAFSL